MKLFIVGGSGRAERHLIEQAVRAGHEITALSHDPERATLSERTAVVKGDVMEPGELSNRCGRLK